MKNLINKIRETIKGSEFENKSFIAGGFVRDMVMDKFSHDIDIVVELPEGGIRLAEFLTKKLNGTDVVIFERFGTAKIVLDGHDVEFVMSRKEDYRENDRKCDVSFGTIEDDVRRRDFTINSMLFDISNSEIIDILNGKSDIENKILRTTSEPDIIFREDPLRMLRAIRFASRLGFTIEDNTYGSIKRNSDMIKTISNERIKDELMKILSDSNFVSALDMLIETDLMDNIGLPELKQCIGVEQNKFHKHDVYNHIIDVMNETENHPLCRLASLLHDIGKPEKRSVDEEGLVHFYEHELKSFDIADAFMRKLKFSNDEIILVTSAVKNHMKFCQDISNRTIRKMRRELGDGVFSFCIKIALADRKSHLDFDSSLFERIDKIMTEIPVNPTNVPINGKMLMEKFNLKPSKTIGDLIEFELSVIEEFPDICEEELFDRIEIYFNQKFK